MLPLTNFLPSLDRTTAIPAVRNLRLTVTRNTEGNVGLVVVVQGNLLNMNITCLLARVVCLVINDNVLDYSLNDGAELGTLKNDNVVSEKLLRPTPVSRRTVAKHSMCPLPINLLTNVAPFICCSLHNIITLNELSANSPLSIRNLRLCVINTVVS